MKIRRLAAAGLGKRVREQSDGRPAKLLLSGGNIAGTRRPLTSALLKQDSANGAVLGF
jgi:hypothetical protein